MTPGSEAKSGYDPAGLPLCLVCGSGGTAMVSSAIKVLIETLESIIEQSI